jgi:hypothetical protein
VRHSSINPNHAANEARLCCEKDIVGRMLALTARAKSLVARQAEHRLFGTSSRWRLSEKMIPKTLVGERFEAWLWRRNGLSVSLDDPCKSYPYPAPR